MVGVADRVRRPGRAAIDAVDTSWTIVGGGRLLCARPDALTNKAV